MNGDNSGLILVLENSKMIFRNFSGAPDKFNPKGAQPSFGVLLNEEVINVGKLEEDGWYVRRLKPNPDDPEQYRQPWIKVNVKMNARRPPTVELIKEGVRFRMDESNISQLDWTRVQYADMVIRSYRYDPDKPMSAWLVDLRVVAASSDLESKYSGIPFAD